MRVVERTSVCSICELPKPWSEFYPQTRWPDGSMRRPRWACSKCESARAAARQREKRAKNPELLRAQQRRRFQEMMADPERAAIRREYNSRQATKARRAAGVPERPWQVGRGRKDADAGVTTKLPLEPFLKFLSAFGDTPAEMARATGVDARALSRYLRGESQMVSLDVVDRACMHTGTSLATLYPDV